MGSRTLPFKVSLLVFAVLFVVFLFASIGLYPPGISTFDQFWAALPNLSSPASNPGGFVLMYLAYFAIAMVVTMGLGLFLMRSRSKSKTPLPGFTAPAARPPPMTSTQLNQLQQLFKISDRIKIDDIAAVLNVRRADLLTRLLDFAGQYHFRIQEDVIVFDTGAKEDFIARLDESFRSWSAPDTKKGN